MNAASGPTLPIPIRRLVISLGAGILLFDTCFWKVKSWGLSEAAFFSVLVILILVNRKGWARRRTCRATLALIAGAAVANLMEPGFSNTIVWLALTVMLAGDTFFDSVAEVWGRWLSQLVAMIRAPGRFLWLASMLGGAAFRGQASPLRRLAQGCLLSLPALVLAFFFGSLLAQGNAIFGAWTQNAFSTIWQWLTGILNPSRIFLWCVAAVFILPLLQPVDVAPWWWTWTTRLPRLKEMSPGPAIFSSGLTLATLNVLFCCANLSDLIFLWHGATLPGGVTYAEFVHHGVEFLIATVLLSAVVLTGIFQQGLNVVRSRLLKLLALAWIAQNLFLILSVALRLKRYIEAYDMSVARLGVIIFLVLVAVGFLLLAEKIIRDRSLSWLVGGCLLAIFGTFYITQFLNLAGWTASYNVAQWNKDRSRPLDVSYLERLGPPAWPALRRAVEAGAMPYQSQLAPETLAQVREQEERVPASEFDLQHWREFSLRAWLNRPALEGAPNY